MRINTSSIPGFEGMTAEEKIEALLKFDIDPVKNGFRTQESFDKVMSEAAGYKRQLEEQKKLLAETKSGSQSVSAENEELMAQIKKLQETQETLLKEKQISEHISRFVTMGYSSELASRAANAYIEGNTEEVFACQQQFLEEHDKAIKAEALKGMKPLEDGSGKGSQDGNDAGIKLAQELGKEHAQSVQATQSVLNQYML